MVKLMPVPQQTNDNACGLFALAFVTNFAEGIDTSERNYEDKALRNHLLQCFRNNQANQFLQEDIFLKSKPSKIVYKVYEVFCMQRCFLRRRRRERPRKLHGRMFKIWGMVSW